MAWGREEDAAGERLCRYVSVLSRGWERPDCAYRLAVGGARTGRPATTAARERQPPTKFLAATPSPMALATV